MEVFLILAGIGASLLLGAARGWALTCKMMEYARDLLLCVGVSNFDYNDNRNNLVKFTNGPAKYVAYVMLGIVAVETFQIMKEGHVTGACIVTGVVVLFIFWPWLFHKLQYACYGWTETFENPINEYEQGLAQIGASGPDDPAIEKIPEDLIVSVGKGVVMHGCGMLVGVAGAGVWVLVQCLFLFNMAFGS